MSSSRLGRLFGASVLVGSLAGCGGEPDDHESRLATRVDCEPSSPSDIVLEVDSGGGRQPNDHDVTVMGRARQKNGLTIRQVIVQGFAANNDGFNYSVWSATIPNAVLLSRASDDGHVTLSVEASDACDQTAKQSVEIDLVAPSQ